MRVQLYIPDPVMQNPLTAKFISELKEGITAMQGLTLVEEDADVVHVFGAWNYSAARKALECRRLLIPYLYSPLGGLTPWMIRLHRLTHKLKALAWQKQLTARAEQVTVWGPKEAAAAGKWNEHVTIVRNSVTSNNFTPEDMAKEMEALYIRISSCFDDKVMERITRQVETAVPDDEENAKQLLRGLLYMRYRYHRRYIPENKLAELGRQMRLLDYDEDAMAEHLDRLRLTRFTTSLLHVLADRAGLTEGFMPIVETADKEAERIEATVKDYQSMN